MMTRMSTNDEEDVDIGDDNDDNNESSGHINGM